MTEVVDRVPHVSDVIDEEEIERIFAPLLDLGVAGLAVFDARGERYAYVAGPHTALRGWEVLPAEAEAVRRGLSDQHFGIGEHSYVGYAVYAGADRVALLVAEGDPQMSEPGRNAAIAAALASLSGLVRAGYARWITSEMHLASAEIHERALSQQNIELQRAIDHLRQLDGLKSNFLATVSHELRTPLTSVIGFADMLLKGLAGSLNPEQSEYVTTILDRGEELLRLITHILELSKVEMGDLGLNLEPVRLHEVLARAASGVAVAAAQSGVKIICEVNDAPPVLADADKIQQVLVNLIANGVKFNSDGGFVRISAALAPIRRPFEEETLFGEEETDAVRVTVSDSGIGISADQRERVFESFYQVDASSTRAHGGAGLGLSIVRRLIQAHGGEIWIDGDAAGTAFHFTLPLANSELMGAGAD